MLTLTLVRHAKASRDDPRTKDFDRPLNARGKDQTKQMSAVLQSKAVVPDFILCSTAKRTRQTLNRLLKDWPCNADVALDGRLYLATAERLRSVLAKCAGNHKHIMMIGHNPGLHLLAFNLAERGDTAHIKMLAERFPTLAICTLRFDGDNWKKLANGELILYTTPKLAGLDPVAQNPK